MQTPLTLASSTTAWEKQHLKMLQSSRASITLGPKEDKREYFKYIKRLMLYINTICIFQDISVKN
jgi:hypothetical protein